MQLTKLKRYKDNALMLTWSDGSTTYITLEKLRNECPCANCKGETVLFESYQPPKLSVHVPGMYELKKVEVVGNYSIQPHWGDGHQTGLYTFNYLRRISSPKEPTAEQATAS
ncbi:MAG: DUF971 domain-containing protein [Chloroherpetonaceae bacterium]|nr:DUF971 domain-containing protein [Chloroherpetonaceae bacterium]